MNTEQKKKLLADVQKAAHALGQVLDGGHDLSQLPTFSAANAAMLRDDCLKALGGLGVLEALL